MGFEEKTLTCVDCGADFTFSAEEQEFYQSKGFENEPKRCQVGDTSRDQKDAYIDAKTGSRNCQS